MGGKTLAALKDAGASTSTRLEARRSSTRARSTAVEGVSLMEFGTPEAMWAPSCHGLPQSSQWDAREQPAQRHRAGVGQGARRTGLTAGVQLFNRKRPGLLGLECAYNRRDGIFQQIVSLLNARENRDHDQRVPDSSVEDQRASY